MCKPEQNQVQTQQDTTIIIISSCTSPYSEIYQLIHCSGFTVFLPFKALVKRCEDREGVYKAENGLG